MHAQSSHGKSRSSPQRQNASGRITGTAEPLSPLDNNMNTSATNPFSSTSRGPHSAIMAEPNASVGQFAFAPATQQTTVVTTTTTTVNMAPFVLRPPQDLHERDPKQYPLAYSHTPASMRRFGFNIGGQLATYMEADDASSFLHKVGSSFNA